MQGLAAGERLLDLCREYGISRKTGSQFKARYEAVGETGLADKSRAPRVVPHGTADVTIELVLGKRRAPPTWGAHELKAYLEPMATCCRRMTPSTVTSVRAGLVVPRKGRRHAPPVPRPTSAAATAPNDLW